MTQGTTRRGLDIEAIEHLDFEHAPPCENRHGCDKTAAWKFIAACCGGVFLFCDACKNLQIRLMMEHPNAIYPCGLCKKKMALGELMHSMERL